MGSELLSIPGIRHRRPSKEHAAHRLLHFGSFISGIVELAADLDDLEQIVGRGPQQRVDVFRRDSMAPG